MKKNKNYTFVVIVCCQGNPTEYEYSNLFSALIGYAKKYLKNSKYETMNFTLKQKFKLVEPQERSAKENGNK